MSLKKKAQALAKKDPKLKPLIEKVGPPQLEAEPETPAYQALMRSIVFQQLNGKAAETIFNRFLALFPKTEFPEPKQVLKLSDETMRGVGLSRNKLLSIRDVAQKELEGKIPGLEKMHKMSDQEIVDALVEIRGVGEWTVQMYLMFYLGREDVLPAGDFGVRNGFRIYFKKRRMPEPEELLKYGERWAPYRTIAAWYMWRAADMSKE